MAPCFQQEIESTLGTVSEVEGVYLLPAARGDGFRVLTVVDRDEDQVYRLIYAQELELARKLPGAQLDFAVIARRGRPVEQVVGEDRPTWEKVAVDEHRR